MTAFDYELLPLNTKSDVLLCFGRRESFRGLSSFVGASEEDGNESTFPEFERVCRLSAMVKQEEEVNAASKRPKNKQFLSSATRLMLLTAGLS